MRAHDPHRVQRSCRGSRPSRRLLTEIRHDAGKFVTRGRLAARKRLIADGWRYGIGIASYCREGMGLRPRVFDPPPLVATFGHSKPVPVFLVRSQCGARGREVYLVDGPGEWPAADEQDLIAMLAPEGSLRDQPCFRPGVSAEAGEVGRVPSVFRRASVVQGSDPDVLTRLAAQPWAFLHFDGALYRPGLAALELFWPHRLPGAAIVGCDYGSPFTPGGRIAGGALAEPRDVSFVVPRERHAVLLEE